VRSFAEARRSLFPDSGAEWIECAGAYAVFDGIDSPRAYDFFQQFMVKHPKFSNPQSSPHLIAAFLSAFSSLSGIHPARPVLHFLG
jgi:hypothetical protein